MSESFNSKIAEAIARFMWPLAKALLRHGVGYRDFESIAKRVFVNVAMEEFGLRGRPTNTSRIAIMTGLTRKEVRALRNSSDTASSVSAPHGSSAAAEVLHVWFTDPRFLGPDRKPKSLAITGEENSFSELVKICASDVPPGAMRAELRRVGAIAIERDDRLTPLRREFVPLDTQSRLVEGLVFGLAPLAETIDFNSRRQNKAHPRFQRVVHTTRLNPRLAVQAEKEITGKLKAFSVDLDNFIGSYELHTADVATTEALDAGVGIYFFIEGREVKDE